MSTVNMQESDSASGAGGVQKSVRTGVANALLAVLKCTAPEAGPWRKRVSPNPPTVPD